jgi:acyl-CoA reductase-like NAD-dependent aldehyde dehydrogenase
MCRKNADAAAIAASNEAFRVWRKVPAPKRGELVRLLGEELRGAKTALGRLVTIETGKIMSEGLGEVLEMIDVCDVAGGPVSSALWSDHRFRATRSPYDGDLASARHHRDHHRLQLSGRGLVVERGARSRHFTNCLTFYESAVSLQGVS